VNPSGFQFWDGQWDSKIFRMSFKEKIPVNTFTAVDSLGQSYEITEWQEFTVTQGAGGQSRLPRVKTLITDRGFPVAVVSMDTGEFKVLDGSHEIPVQRDWES